VGNVRIETFYVIIDALNLISIVSAFHSNLFMDLLFEYLSHLFPDQGFLLETVERYVINYLCVF